MRLMFVGALAVTCATLAIAGCSETPRAPAQDTQTASSSLNQQDALLLAAVKIALPPHGLAPADLPDPTSRGAQLLGTFCAQCHALPSPATHSATDWPEVTRRMWLRMEWLPPAFQMKVPTVAERSALLQYLNANALKVSGANLPTGRGREDFALVCSRCHALPDPRGHSSADWPTVFARMELNMERMKVPPPTATQTTDILLYLQDVASRR